MGKRNKKKLKQRKKRQLKKAIKQGAKAGKVVKAVHIPDYLPPVVEPPVDTNEKYQAKDKTYQEKLDKVYGGTITALTHYVNSQCSMTFKCNSCGLVFFGKAGHIISDKVHQHHECGMPYGTVEGERFGTVSAIKHKRKSKNLAKQREQQFFDMLWNDYTPQEIASKLKVNPKIIKEYFIKEGLIEVESGQ